MSSDEEPRGLQMSMSTKPKQTKFALGPLRSRRKSTGDKKAKSTFQIQSSHYRTNKVDKYVTSSDEQDDISDHKLTHTKSNSEFTDSKAAWGAAIAAQETVQHSLKSLRKNLEAYEAKASEHKWREVVLEQTNLEEVHNLAQAAKEKHQKGKNRAAKWFDKFSLVALEYSRLLDVVFNTCPEYVSAAWGALKILLVANLNSSRLKENVEAHLIAIGKRLGLVNQLLCYTPTEKMVEAISLLYASFSKFLGKALKCYKKCRLAKMLEGFTFPWETKFEYLVMIMDQQFGSIKDLAQTSHHHISIRNQHLLHTIRDCVQEHTIMLQRKDKAEQSYNKNNNEMKEQVRAELKEEMKHEISRLLGTFHAKLVQRFDEFVAQQNTAPSLEHRINDYPSKDRLNLNKPNTINVKDYLASFASSPGEMMEFRNTCYPALNNLDQTESFLRVRNRRLRAFEYQQCVTLLKNPNMQDWLSERESRLLWIDSYLESRITDWATALVLDLVDHTQGTDFSVVVKHFCQGNVRGQPVSTAALIVQSMIFQLLAQCGEHFRTKDSRFTRQRFETAGRDIDELWNLFVDILRSLQAGCIWIMIDNVGLLQRESGEEQLAAIRLLQKLKELVDHIDVTVKVLITARFDNSCPLSQTLDIDSPRSAVLTVPRRLHQTKAAFSANKARKYARLPDANTSEPRLPPLDTKTVEALLFASDSDSDESEDIHIPLRHVNSEDSTSQRPSREDHDDDCTTDTDLYEDPFAESPDSDEEESPIKHQDTVLHSCSSEDSLIRDGVFIDTRASGSLNGSYEHLLQASESEDEDFNRPLISPVTPKVTVSPAMQLPSHPRIGAHWGKGGVNDQAHAEKPIGSSEKTEHSLRVKDDLESESDSD